MTTTARVETWASLACIGCSRYEVSDMGQVRNDEGLILAQSVTKKGRGYPAVRMTHDDGRRHGSDVHVLMMLAFDDSLPTGPDGMRKRPLGPDGRALVVRHGDLGKVNWLENLQWGTWEDNERDRWGRYGENDMRRMIAAVTGPHGPGVYTFKATAIAEPDGTFTFEWDWKRKRPRRARYPVTVSDGMAWSSGDGQ